MQYELKQGHRYHAKVVVSGWKGMLAGESDVADRLQQAGFDDVSVRKTGSGEFDAWGTWYGDDGWYEKPDEVQGDPEDLGVGSGAQ